MKKINYFTIILILISFILAFYSYNYLPDEVASHWNSKGEVDDTMPKFWGAFFMPIISLVLFSLLTFIPKIDPLKKNIKDFKKYYDGFIFAMVTFLFIIYLFTLLFNLNIINFEITYIILPALAFLFFYLGVLMEKTKRNWFIGIRNPWTLSSDKVWKKTHKLGGKLFKIVAILTLIGLLFKNQAFWFFLIPVLLVVVYLFYYSYKEYKK